MGNVKDQWINSAMNTGGVNRRRFLRDTGKLGLAAMGSTMLANTLSTAALADTDFDWKRHKGKKIKLLMNKHPYTNESVAALDNFKKLTGIDVDYDIFPEDVYFQKVTSSMSSGSSEYDVFMTGAYQLWQYGPAGYVVDLNPYISDPEKTADTYKWSDFRKNMRDGLAWTGKVGDPLGGPGSHQWAVPMVHEFETLTYNQPYIERAGIDIPENMPDLIDKAQHVQKKMDSGFGIAVRGSRSWATIHPAYMSGLANYGGTDFTQDENGRLVSAVNSDACKHWTGLFLDLVKKAGPSDWTGYTWYEVGQAMGAGKAAMMYGADINGFFQQTGTAKAGQMAYAPFTPNPDENEPTSNIWIWSLAISSFSKKKDAAWYFLQWATGTQFQSSGAVNGKCVDPVRESVFNDRDFQKRLKQDYPGYSEAYSASAPKAKILFTPQPLFFNVTTQWAATLQKMYNDQMPVDEGLDQLAEKIDHQMRAVNG